MSLEQVFLMLGWGLLGAILVTALCSSGHPEADRAREWINTATSVVTLVVLAWTASSIVDQVTEMRKVYPEIQSQSKAMTDQVNSFIGTERAAMFVLPTGVQRSGDKDPKPRITFMIVNMGRTAALVKGLLIECDVPMSLARMPSYDERRLIATYAFVGGGSRMPLPEGSECVPSQPLTDDDFAGLAAKTRAIVFKGYILYQDVLGETWKKHFGMYGFGDGKFFGMRDADAYNAEEKVEPGPSLPLAVKQ